jgi:anti-anti-sigma regulatory factor
VSWINSTGLGLLIGGLIRVRQLGGTLVLAAPRARVQDLLRVGRFPLDVFSSEEEALQALRDPELRVPEGLNFSLGAFPPNRPIR